MVSIIQPKKEESICDPACGTAGFLISSYKHILQENSKKNKGDLLTPDDRKKLINNFVGYDISSEMVRLSLVNLYLHGFTTPKIFEYDTLTSVDRWGDYFDIILANPPFMTPKGGIRPHKKFAMQANRSEVLFVDYIMEHINPTTGRAAVIVPEGIIFQSATAYKALRKLLIDKNFLYGVVSLPAGIFQPYSGVKTSILLIDKTLAKKTDKVLFVKVDNDGFALGAQRKELSTSDLPEAANLIRHYITAIRNDDYSNIDYSNLPSNTLIVEKSKIAKNDDYNLSGDRFRVNAANQNTKFDLVTLGDVCTFIGGYAFKSSELSDEQLDGQLPVIKIGNLDKEGYVDISSVQYYTYDDSLKKYRIVKDDILMAMTGATVGKVAISNSDNLLLNQRVGLIRANEALIKKEFLKMLLLSERFYEYCQFTAGGGAQGNISPTDIMNFKFPLPPLSYQEIISDRIVVQNKIISGAKQVVENYKPQIDINPEWEMVELDEVCLKITDGSHFSPDTIEKGYPYITVKDIVGDKIDFDNCKFIDEINYFELVKNDCKPLKNDILFSKDGTVGKVSLVDFEKDFVVLSSLAIIRPNTKIINPYFLKSILQSEYFLNLAIENKTGVAIKRIVLKTLKTIPIPNLSIQEQEKIVERIRREQLLVNSNVELIELIEQKIKDEINKLWSE
jgi:type I restriction enzyme M protein